MKIGLISARAHLVSAIRKHREVFRNWESGGWPDQHATQKANDDIGAARSKLRGLGIGGKCNEHAYSLSSDVMRAYSRERSRAKRKKPVRKIRLGGPIS